MAILATLQPNLFSSLPNTPPSFSSHPPTPIPIPIPKYPPPRNSPKSQTHPKTSPPSKTHPKTPKPHPSLKITHHNSKYYKPIKPGDHLVSSSDRTVVVGESGVSYLLPGAPFEFSYSYSETPKAKPLALREPAFLPFAPPSMPRPWTGKAPLKKKKKRNIKLFKPLGYNDDDDDDEEEEEEEDKGVSFQMLRGYELGRVRVRPRGEVLGHPLSKMEIKEMIRPLLRSNKQVNLGEFLCRFSIL